MKRYSLTLNDIVLLAAFKLSNGDVNKEFTAEDLLIKAWEINKSAFGLRGYEQKYPDSNILYTKLMGRSGLVRNGYLKKVGEKTYTMTEAGLSLASSLTYVNSSMKTKIDRRLHDAILKLLNHKVYNEWKADNSKPTDFRDAMWFWGIAPGNPPNIVKERIAVIEKNLAEGKKHVMDLGGKFSVGAGELNADVKANMLKNNTLTIDKERGQLLLDVSEIENCFKFHNDLKKKFEEELNYMLKGN